MDEIGLIQDLAMVLLAAGVAGALCRRIGLSVIVGYLLAGIVVGPFTPPFSWIIDIQRIQTLSQVGLVFLMFGIGLGLSLSKLGRMGWPTLIATGLGAFLVLNFTKGIGLWLGWTPQQTLFMSSMFMVSSSAVIAKIVSELNLTHDRSAQRALSITVLEDVVAVTMLTILGSQIGGTQTEIGRLLAGLTAFVVLLAIAGLLMVPRLMRRLEARADPELQSIIVAGLLFLLALAAVKAGYSLALGAFLLGAIVAELPQKGAVEKAFVGMRDIFSAVFFVSIGMMIELRLVAEVWPAILGLGVFVLVARSLALSLALIFCGTPVREARRAGLLLSPLGEFSFIIAQMGVTASILPNAYYPLAVGVSIFTVLTVPLINRYAEPLLAGMERLEPTWWKRAVEAYQVWLTQLQSSKPSSVAWRFIRGRLLQLALEMMFVTGLLLFSPQLYGLVIDVAGSLGLAPRTLGYLFWGSITVITLIPLVAVWRNVSAMTLIYAESVATERLPHALILNVLRGVTTLALAVWLYAVLPLDALSTWSWLAMGTFAALVIVFYSRRLIFWHSEWHDSVRTVLHDGAEADSQTDAASRHFRRLEQGLQDWKVQLRECQVPDSAECAGLTLAQLDIPNRFGCAVLEIERNGIVITALRPDLRLYPGDKLLLMGEASQLAAAQAGLTRAHAHTNDSEAFKGSVLETLLIPPGPWSGRTLAELNVGKLTGTRIVGVQRAERRLIAPSGGETLETGDQVLVAGTLQEIAAFKRWLGGVPA